MYLIFGSLSLGTLLIHLMLSPRKFIASLYVFIFSNVKLTILILISIFYVNSILTLSVSALIDVVYLGIYVKFLIHKNYLTYLEGKNDKENALVYKYYYFDLYTWCRNRRLFGYKMNINLAPNPQKLEYGSVIMHNLGVVGILAAGIVTLGIGTLGIIFINGSSLGITLGAFHDKHYFSDIVMALIPHGILEIPAFIIAGAGDLYVVSSIILLIMKKKKRLNLTLKED